jgi:thiamine biosynthesis lipoprotein
MASPIRVQLGPDTNQPQRRHREIRALFTEVERQCTRFDPGSDLMRANAAGESWWPVGVHCYAALRAAAEAHAVTGARFDPRVLTTLQQLGYRASLPFEAGLVETEDAAGAPVVLGSAWNPGFDDERRSVRIGSEPVDLGGIGKGLALRWAADLLHDAGCAVFLIDAGGDCICAGGGPDGGGWSIGIEDPAGRQDPVAVVRVDDGACATSSVRVRTWQAGGRTVHHLIDPATGTPGGAGLRSVTVLGADPAIAEVWSKALFLTGEQIEAEADKRDLAALWVSADGAVRMSATMPERVIWLRS